MSEPVGQGAVAKSPMEQLSQDPQLGPIISQLRGEKLYQALKARLEAEPHSTRRRLLEEVLSNRRWFVEPVSGAPSLRTVNGIGTMLYGSSDKDPSDGSYVATLCFVFFFIPIFPIAQYLVRSMGGRKWSFFGKVPISPAVKRWRQLVGLSVAAVALAITWGVVEHAGHSDVHFVNGLDVPVKIHVGKLDLRVGANARHTQRMSQGPYDIKVTTDDGRVLEEQKVVVPGATDVVAYNVLGAAPLYHAPVTYYAAGREGKDKDEPIFDAGKRLISEDHIDFVFQEPPKEITMGESETKATRWHFDLAPGGWKLSAFYLLSQKQGEQAAKIVEAVANASPDDEAVMEDVIPIVVQVRGTAGLEELAQQLMKRFPDALQPQRLYQSVMLGKRDKREELIQQYRERAAKNPDSATAGYLAARLEFPAEGVVRYQALAAKFPGDAHILHGLAWVLLELRRFPEAATQFEALGKLPHHVNIDELEGMAQALVAGQKSGEAAKNVAAHGEESSDAAKLYARVAAIAGKDAPFPPDHFIEPKGAARSWYEASLGAPGAFEKLPPLEGPAQGANAVIAAARRNGVSALAVLDKAPPESLTYLDRPLGLVLAAQALKHEGAERAGEILDGLSPPAGAAEREAVLSGKGSPEIGDMSLEVQAALEVARAWRLGGAEGHKLMERAKADDLLRVAAASAVDWR